LGGVDEKPVIAEVEFDFGVEFAELRGAGGEGAFDVGNAHGSGFL
jgi:hypothetical protein